MKRKKTVPADFYRILEASPDLYLILSPQLHIVAVSDAYLQATLTQRDSIIGKYLFDVFPDNPDDPAAEGVRKLRESLNKVLETKAPDKMPTQKYDVQRPGEQGGEFEARYWSVLNSPVLDEEGNVSYIIHRAENITSSVTADQLRSTESQQLHENMKMSDKMLKDYESRMNVVLEKLLNYTLMDFSEKIEVTDNGDEVDAIAVGLNTLTEELESYIHKVKESEERFRLLINDVKDYAICMLSPEGYVTTWNKGAENIKGYTAAEAIGKHFSLFYTEEEIKNGEPEHNLREARERGRYENEGWRKRKNGSVFWANVVMTALYTDKGELRGFAKITRDMTERKQAEELIRRKNWVLEGISDINSSIRKEKNTTALSQEVINRLIPYLKAQVGAIYIAEDHQLLKFAAGYAFGKDQAQQQFMFGEGLVGQAAVQKKIIRFDDVPDNYIKIRSSLGNISPAHLLIAPLVFDDEVKGVIEIGTLKPFTEAETEYLNIAVENIAIAVHSAQGNERTKELLRQTQQQAEELETQQEELKQINEELSKQRNRLQSSEEELKVQQEELLEKNTALQLRTEQLKVQNENVQLKNRDLETIREALVLKAKELEQTSRYKSEFLANMSHELRTPLNSILILAQLLSENKNKTLGPKETEFAKNIYNSGHDLLTLINEILDLSTVESGKMELEIAGVYFSGIVQNMQAVFSELAKNRKVDFSIHLGEELQGSLLHTDQHRLEQILKNLLSNAFKFTPAGGTVKLDISKSPEGQSYKNAALAKAKEVVRFSVSDNGIGIPKDKLNIIFEAFQQADGSTKRKYGGTGLGLSISRELSAALGGEIRLSSEEGKGSEFSLFVPMEYDHSLIDTSEAAKQVQVVEHEYQDFAQVTPEADIEFTESEPVDDRNNINENDRVILIVEDEEDFANILLDFVRERNYKGIIARQGNTGLSYARQYKPDAILLDMKLPVLDGTEVLKQIKHDPELRHIPVQIISAFDGRKKEGMELGAFDYIPKPVTTQALQKTLDNIEKFVSKKLKKLLIVEDNQVQNTAISELIGDNDVKCFSAYSGAEAYEMLNREEFDCIIVDLGLPDMTGFQFLEKLKADQKLNRIPVIVYTGKDLSREENARLNKLADTVVLKTADSQERLLDEAVLFLHRVESNLSKEKQRMIRKLHRTDEVLKNKNILIVDDDIRNIYSITNVLENEDAHCLIADNGKEALRVLNEHPEIDLVLMDVMMPEMDGYEATKEIRRIKKFSSLPIIALTAKAMKGDKEKCLAVGMSDYISKPVNVDQLLSLMRVWLYK